MKFNNITLSNIGPYMDENTFNFTSDIDKKVVLIGGKNGAGKTTLLNSIKIGLFGSFSFGYKADNKEYFSRINQMLNNAAKESRTIQPFSISMDLNMNEGFESKNYVLKRSWKIQNERVREYVQVQFNGQYLNEQELITFQNKLRESLPPELLDFCLFDGEEIANIVNNDELSTHLSALSKIVFKLNWFESLEEDLEVYSRQSLSSSNQNHVDLKEASTKQKELRTRSNDLSNSLIILKEHKEDLQEEIDQYKLDFEQNGGIVKAERESILGKIHELEVDRKSIIDEIKSYTANMLPLQLAISILGDAREQIAKEESVHFVSKLDNLLGDDQLETVLKQINLPETEENKSNLKESLLSSLDNEGSARLIHDASFSDSSMVEQTFIKVKEISPTSIREKMQESTAMLQQIRVWKDKLKINDTTSEFEDILAQIERLQKELVLTSERIDNEQKEYQLLEKELEIINNTVEKLEHQISSDSKTDSSFKDALKIIQLSEKFRKIQLQKKLQEVEREALFMLNKLLRKKNYIHAIDISTESFEVELLDADRKVLNKLTLSSGEKQMLLIALIWAIFKCSGREVPFIFDTLLGRLDKDHKRAVLLDFIPHAGTQAIILSTDSEIDAEYYGMLSPYLAKEYTLNFQVSNQATTILHEYLPMLTKGDVRV
ncbi:DNA sulfur modification protein DndD [Sporosarcina ureae]|uniref:Nuclease SbcCD subunit C n=1 Tax=Sporosarcina ureae TaxID=1571 RepID=A0ABM6JUZ1_SPOUR|nr:DNA sulfur modification protein DndD [Sporosarcina ureae]ARF14005.1 hypothetical protein SporoS204_07510 [Sporosarcina ureae]